MFKETTGHHHVVSFDSLGELTAYSKTLPDHRSDGMPDRSYYGSGVSNMSDVHKIADNGLAREGIEAIKLANVDGAHQDVKDQQFQTRWDTQGSDVDVARYLSGEPENMLAYWSEDIEDQQAVAVLVVNIAVNCNVTSPAFKKHGQSLVALAEAIDTSGMQSEIWVDAFIDGRDGYTGRFKLLAKAPGEIFDPGAFMFTLTHPSFFRAMQLNAMHDWPKAWHEPIGIGYGYGHAVTTFEHPEDYPAGAIYIPAMRQDSDAGKHLPLTLKTLGLT